MSGRFFKVFTMVVVLVYLPLRSLCWGMEGHRIVGEIAESYLTVKARAEVRKILGNESIAMASNWPDFIKSDTNFKYLSHWHYVDFDKGLTYEQLKEVLKKDTAMDAYTAINFLTKELRKKTLDKDKKQTYLKLLIHIVGDVHQPLHVSPLGTEGGNMVRLTWFGENSNLHRVWDEHLIEYQKLSYTEYTKAINHTTNAQKLAWQKQPLSQWIYESYSIAEKLHEELTEQNPKLSYRYNFDHVATVNEQLLKGGVRLAGLLNEIYK